MGEDEEDAERHEEAEQTPDRGEGEGLEQELRLDVARFRADRELDADLARSLLDDHVHDVRDPRPPTMSVNDPITPRKARKVRKKTERNFSPSVVSHIPTASLSFGSNFSRRPSTS